MPAGVHNGSRIQGSEREAIITAIADGQTGTDICERFSISPCTYRAIRETEWLAVDKRKALLRAQAERGAYEAGEKVIEAVRNGDIKGSALVPAYGVFVDKVVALSGDGPAAQQHLHIHGLSDNDIVAFAVHLTKTGKAQPKSIEATVIPDENPAVLG